MRKNYLLLVWILGLVAPCLRAQELQANITVLANRLPSTVDHKIFQTLQSALRDFVNTRKWSNESFQNNEKIACNFLLNISSAGDNNTFQASFTIPAGRSLVNSSSTRPPRTLYDA